MSGKPKKQGTILAIQPTERPQEASTRDPWLTEQLAGLDALRVTLRSARTDVLEQQQKFTQTKLESDRETEAAYLHDLAIVEKARQDQLAESQRTFDTNIAPAVNRVLAIEIELNAAWDKFYEDAEKRTGINYRALISQLNTPT